MTLKLYFEIKFKGILKEPNTPRKWRLIEMKSRLLESPLSKYQLWENYSPPPLNDKENYFFAWVALVFFAVSRALYNNKERLNG